MYYKPNAKIFNKIINWKGGFCDLMEYIKSYWWEPNWGWRETSRRYYLSTGGHSDNEDLLNALSENKQRLFMFHLISFRRGGHYVFEKPKQGDKT